MCRSQFNAVRLVLILLASAISSSSFGYTEGDVVVVAQATSLTEGAKEGDEVVDRLAAGTVLKVIAVRSNHLKVSDGIVGWLREDDVMRLTKKTLTVVKGRVKENPEQAELYLLLGGVWKARGEATLAQWNYEKALERDPKIAHAYRCLGDLKVDGKQFREAIKLYGQAIDLDPTLTLAWNNRGYAYERLRKYAAAAQNYQGAIDANPRFSRGYFNLANMQLEEKRYQLAIKNYTKAIQAETDVFKAIVSRGDASTHLGRLNDALDDYSQALRMKPDDLRAVLARATLWMMKKEWQRAVRDLDKALELRPQDVGALFARSTAHRHLGDAVAALSDVEQVLKLDPKHREASIARAALLAMTGDKQAAAEAFANSVDPKSGSATEFLARANARLEAGDRQGAREDLDRALKLDPKLPTALINRGMLRFDSGELDLAIIDLNRAVRYAPEHSHAYHNRALVLKAQGKVLEAHRDFSKAIDLDPKLAVAWKGRADIFLGAQVFDKAHRDISESLLLDDSNPDSYRVRGDALVGLGKLDEAMQDYQESYRRDASQWSAQLGFARVHFARKDFQRARDEIDKIEVTPENQPELLRELLRISMSMNDLQTAEQTLHLLVEQEPASLPVHGALAHVHLLQGKYAAAQATCEQVLARIADRSLPHEENPRNREVSEVLGMRAILLAGQGKEVDALEDATHATQLEGRAIQAPLIVAAIRHRRGEYEQALEAYDLGLRQLAEHRLTEMPLARLLNRGRYLAFVEQPVEPPLIAEEIADFPEQAAQMAAAGGAELAKLKQALIVRGRIRELMMDHELAVVDYSELVELAPDDPIGYQLRGDLYTDLQELDRAFIDLTKVTQLAPDSARAWTMRGGLRLRMQHAKRAVEDLTRAIEIEPQDLASRVLRRAAYAELGEYELAIKDVDVSLELYPDASMYLTRAELKVLAGRLQDAVEDVRQAKEISAKSASVSMSWIDILLAVDQYEEAETNLGELIEEHSRVAVLYAFRGYARQRLDKFDLAMNDYNEAIILSGDSALALMGRGDLNYRLGNYKQAEIDYRRANELQQNNTMLLARRAWIYATCTDHKVRDSVIGEHLAAHAVSLAGGTLPLANQALAACHAHQRDFDQAIAVQTKVVKDLRKRKMPTTSAETALQSFQAGMPHRETPRERAEQAKSSVAAWHMRRLDDEAEH